MRDQRYAMQLAALDTEVPPTEDRLFFSTHFFRIRFEIKEYLYQNITYHKLVLYPLLLLPLPLPVERKLFPSLQELVIETEDELVLSLRAFLLPQFPSIAAALSLDRSRSLAGVYAGADKRLPELRGANTGSSLFELLLLVGSRNLLGGTEETLFSSC
jgi:hypothetical protein